MLKLKYGHSRIPQFVAMAAIAVGMSACAGRGGDIAKGGLIGAGAGAAVGAVVPGISTVEGAAVGAAGGAVYGALKDNKGRTVYQDENGNKYWVDKKGRRHYY